MKVSKLGAGYVKRDGTDYRCIDCWKFIPETERCAEAHEHETARPFGSCINWAQGPAVPGLKPRGAYTLEELGYTEDRNGTKCKRCRFYDIEAKNYCHVVDENSEGDTPGIIDPNACCDNQEPRNPTMRSL